MKTEDQNLRFVRWSDEDELYVGYCPDLFPWGSVCHSPTEEETYRQLCALVREEIVEIQSEGREIPSPQTRPMREALLA